MKFEFNNPKNFISVCVLILLILCGQILILDAESEENQKLNITFIISDPRNPISIFVSSFQVESISTSNRENVEFGAEFHPPKIVQIDSNCKIEILIEIGVL